MPRVSSSRFQLPKIDEIDEGYLADADEPVSKPKPTEDVFETAWNAVSGRGSLRFSSGLDCVQRAINALEPYGICAIGLRGARVLPPPTYLPDILEIVREHRKPCFAIFYMSADAVVTMTYTLDHAKWLHEIQIARPASSEQSSGSIAAGSITYEQQLRFLERYLPGRRVPSPE